MRSFDTIDALVVQLHALDVDYEETTMSGMATSGAGERLTYFTGPQEPGSGRILIFFGMSVSMYIFYDPPPLCFTP